MISLSLQAFVAAAVLFMSYSAAAEVSEKEITALFQLHNNTNGEFWLWRNIVTNGPVWNFTRNSAGDFIDNPCVSGWQGIICSEDPQQCSGQICHITTLSLPLYDLRGSLPPEIGDLVLLETLALDNNALVGPIPSEIGNLVMLEWLGLSLNTLTSTIPAEIEKLTALEILLFNDNALTGPIPPAIGNLTSLQRCHLSTNMLTGPIPTEFGSLVMLERLYLSYNALTGPIPCEIGNPELLEVLYLNDNALTGHIPPEIGNLDDLVWLYLFDNCLTGHVPLEIEGLLALYDLDFSYNALTGPIPPGVGSSPHLVWLFMNNNALTGTIPPEIGNLVSLGWLEAHNNSLTGAVPSEIGHLTLIEVLYLSVNKLNGHIPPEIGSLLCLEYLDLSYNSLSGSIPPDISRLTALEVIFLDRNSLTGSIPIEIGNATALEWLDLDANALTGPIPSEIGDLLRLEILDLGRNSLTGTIPSQVGGLLSLESLFVNSNALTGHVDDLWSSTATPEQPLAVLDLSENKLSGQSLNALFRLPFIQVLALSVNCFHVELPEVMCEAATIEVLSLNGLGAAKGCPNTIKLPFSGVSVVNSVGGTLPDCVWHMRNLTTLHLTGNGLKGTVISHLPGHSAMEDLSLSHNQFSGEIPLNVQKVRRVDLSYNQFSGEYEDTVEEWRNDDINLEINRLSGHVSVLKLENVSDVNILRGNLISCGSIPANDDHAHDYNCGSQNLNESFFVLGTAVALTCCIILAMCLAATPGPDSTDLSLSWVAVRRYLSRLRRPATLLRWRGRSTTTVQPVEALCDKFKLVIRLFVQLPFIILVMVAPVYVIRGIDTDAVFSTHSNTYSWFWTLAYMQGALPAGFILLSWFVAVAVCFYRIKLAPFLARETVRNVGSNSCDMSESSNGGVSSCCGLKNSGADFVKTHGWTAAALITVNAFYIYASHQPLSTAMLFSIQLSLALFQMVYSRCAIPILSSNIEDFIANIIFRLRLLVVNTLAIPCFVTALASPSCFQGLLREADGVSTPYTYKICSAFVVFPDSEVCVKWGHIKVESAPVTPPFVYSNQCASVLLTSYIPVLILSFSIQLVLTFVLPVMLFHVGKFINLRGVAHGIIWPEYWLSSDTSRNETELAGESNILLHSTNIICFSILNNLVILLTFGLTSPLLTIAVAFAAVSKMSVLLLMVRRFSAVLRGGDQHEGVHFLQMALARVRFPLMEVLQRSFWLIVSISALFFTLVCWDTASDEVGWLESIWIPCATLCYPLILRAVDWGVTDRRVEGVRSSGDGVREEDFDKHVRSDEEGVSQSDVQLVASWLPSREDPGATRGLTSTVNPLTGERCHAGE